MKTGPVLISATVAILGSLLIRRIIRIRRSRACWTALAQSLGLHNSPIGRIRIALTGASSGIGRACMELLKPYGSIEFISAGRRPCSPGHLQLNLSDPRSVKTTVNDLMNQWYRRPGHLLPGSDIFVNNAGVFYGESSNDVVLTNLFSPCYITEAIATRFTSQNLKSRQFRFVQVVSRLEKNSTLDRESLPDWLTNCLSDSRRSVPVNLYADTKRALILHTAFASQSSQKSVSYIAVTPGMVNTPLGKAGVSRFIWWISAPIRFLLLRHPIEGAVSVLYAAFGYPEETGIYTADPTEVLERISETRDIRAGEIVSERVNHFFSSI